MGEWMDEKVEGEVLPPFTQSAAAWADSTPVLLALSSSSSFLSLLVSPPILRPLDLARLWALASGIGRCDGASMWHWSPEVGIVVREEAGALKGTHKWKFVDSSPSPLWAVLPREFLP